jgi:hypothetical protein
LDVVGNTKISFIFAVNLLVLEDFQFFFLSQFFTVLCLLFLVFVSMVVKDGS